MHDHATHDHVYRVTEIVGTSHEGTDAAIRNAISRASSTLRHVDWFEVVSTRGHVEDGGLISYAPDMAAQFHRGATYVDRILKGAKPADLPVEQPTKFELAINMKAAKSLNLTIPLPLLGRADKVIE